MQLIQNDKIDLPDSLDAGLYDRYGAPLFAYLRLRRASWENDQMTGTA
jgi:hypothetical protein